MILLDTHAAIWLDSGKDRLGAAARETIHDALANRDLHVSAATFWEIGLLVRKKRLQPRRAPLAWRAAVLLAGWTELPLTGAIAIAAEELADFHGDPADRFLVATAIEHEMPLLTADRRILAWPGRVARIDAAR